MIMALPCALRPSQGTYQQRKRKAVANLVNKSPGNNRTGMHNGDRVALRIYLATSRISIVKTRDSMRLHCAFPQFECAEHS